MARQKDDFEKTKEAEMDAQYQREQEMYENRLVIYNYSTYSLFKGYIVNNYFILYFK